MRQDRLKKEGEKYVFSSHSPIEWEWKIETDKLVPKSYFGEIITTLPNLFHKPSRIVNITEGFMLYMSCMFYIFYVLQTLVYE